MPFKLDIEEGGRRKVVYLAYAHELKKLETQNSLGNFDKRYLRVSKNGEDIKSVEEFRNNLGLGEADSPLFSGILIDGGVIKSNETMRFENFSDSNLRNISIATPSIDDHAIPLKYADDNYLGTIPVGNRTDIPAPFALSPGDEFYVIGSDSIDVDVEKDGTKLKFSLSRAAGADRYISTGVFDDEFDILQLGYSGDYEDLLISLTPLDGRYLSADTVVTNWSGSSSGLDVVDGRAALGLGSMALEDASDYMKNFTFGSDSISDGDGIMLESGTDINIERQSAGVYRINFDGEIEDNRYVSGGQFFDGDSLRLDYNAGTPSELFISLTPLENRYGRKDIDENWGSNTITANDFILT